MSRFAKRHVNKKHYSLVVKFIHMRCAKKKKNFTSVVLVEKHSTTMPSMSPLRDARGGNRICRDLEKIEMIISGYSVWIQNGECLICCKVAVDGQVEVVVPSISHTASKYSAHFPKSS